MVTSDRTGTHQRTSKQFSSQVSHETGTLWPWHTIIPFPRLCSFAITLIQKKKNYYYYYWILVHILECSFLCTNLLTCILLHSLHCKKLDTCILSQFPLQSSVTCISFHQLLLLTSISHSQKKTNKFWHNQNRKLQDSGANREHNRRKTTAFFFHTLYFIIFFLSHHFSLIFLYSVYPFLPLFALLPVFLYFSLLSLRLWPQN